jgi:putative SOS response-associated peptidase YedK
MCFHINITSTLEEISQRFNVYIDKNSFNFTRGDLSAFTFPIIPVITNKNPDKLQFYQWGLIPSWWKNAKNDDIKKYTLNARWETLLEKPAFKNSIENRCLIIVDGFYEWQWLDSKGKKKQKYFITVEHPYKKPFAIAGLYNDWLNLETGEILPTCTIITVKAMGIMEEIHNTKKRMPLILEESIEKEWLNKKILSFPYVPLKAIPV